MSREEFFPLLPIATITIRKQLVQLEILTGCSYIGAAEKGLSNQQSSVFKAFRPRYPCMVVQSGAIGKAGAMGKEQHFAFGK